MGLALIAIAWIGMALSLIRETPSATASHDGRCLLSGGVVCSCDDAVGLGFSVATDAKDEERWCPGAEDEEEDEERWCAGAEDEEEDEERWCPGEEDEEEDEERWCAGEEDEEEDEDNDCVREVVG